MWETVYTGRRKFNYDTGRMEPEFRLDWHEPKTFNPVKDKNGKVIRRNGNSFENPGHFGYFDTEEEFNEAYGKYSENELYGLAYKYYCMLDYQGRDDLEDLDKLKECQIAHKAYEEIYLPLKYKENNKKEREYRWKTAGKLIAGLAICFVIGAAAMNYPAIAWLEIIGIVLILAGI